MKKLALIFVAGVLATYVAISQESSHQGTGNKEELAYRHSIGSSLFMLFNLTEESADYGLLTYGYQLSNKDRVFAEFVTWKYAEPMGTYGNSEKNYPGYVRCYGIGTGYQRFVWKGLFATGRVTNFFKQYYDENDNKTQTGYQLYLQAGIGYRIEFFNKRLYVEPAWLIKYWPVDTNIPDDFAAIDEGTPQTKWEPSLNFGFKF